MRNLIAAVFGLTLVAGTALAESRTTPAFYELDVNADGFVTRAELSGAGSYRVSFGKLDTNKDGRISKSEYAAAASTYRGR